MGSLDLLPEPVFFITTVQHCLEEGDKEEGGSEVSQDARLEGYI